MEPRPKNSRPIFPVPEYVRTPEKLQHLAAAMGVDPEKLLATVEDDYAGQLRTHEGIYRAEGAEKGGLLIHVLEQCKQIAANFEQEHGEPDHLSRTLEHVQAHLAVLVGDYEQQLRDVRRSAPKDAPDA